MKTKENLPLFPPETRDSKTENLFSTPWDQSSHYIGKKFIRKKVENADCDLLQWVNLCSNGIQDLKMEETISKHFETKIDSFSTLFCWFQDDYYLRRRKHPCLRAAVKARTPWRRVRDASRKRCRRHTDWCRKNVRTRLEAKMWDPVSKIQEPARSQIAAFRPVYRYTGNVSWKKSAGRHRNPLSKHCPYGPVWTSFVS